jgi:hypothetical protein
MRSAEQHDVIGDFAHGYALPGQHTCESTVNEKPAQITLRGL